MKIKLGCSVPRRRTLWMMLFLVLIFATALLVGGLYSGRKKQDTESRRAVVTTQSQPLVLGWEIVDYLLSHRAAYKRDLGEQDLPDFSYFTDEYFRTLKARRDAVIEWARSAPSTPLIVFFGQLHALGKGQGENTPEELRRIAEHQSRLFDAVSQEAQKAQVIAIEESGCGEDETITPEVFVRILRESTLELHGMRISEEEARSFLLQATEASVRTVFELSTPAVCGEEWPHWMNVKLMGLRYPAPLQEEARKDLITALIKLRSEIILIRTLEALHRRNGSKGIIIQGDIHRQYIEREQLASIYHITFIGHPPQ